MNRRVEATIMCVLLGATLIGCSNTYNTQSSTYSKLEEKSLSYYKNAEACYIKQVDIAKSYELNAVLNATDTYAWNPTREGDIVTEDEYNPKGVYSLESLEKSLGVSWSVVDDKLNRFKKEESSAQGSAINLVLSKSERVVHADIQIRYYLETETNANTVKKFTEDGSRSTPRLIQVVSVVGTDFSVEQCITWSNGNIVSFSKQSSI